MYTYDTIMYMVYTKLALAAFNCLFHFIAVILVSVLFNIHLILFIRPKNLLYNYAHVIITVPLLYN